MSNLSVMRSLGWMVALLLVAAATVTAAPPTETQSNTKPSLETLEQQMTAYAQAAADLTTRSQSVNSQQAALLKERAMQYRLLENASERLITARQKGDRLRAELTEDPKQSPSSLVALSETYSLSAYDAVLGELETLVQRRENLALELEIARAALENTETQSEHASRDLRLKKEAQAAAADTTDTTSAWALEALRLEAQRLGLEAQTKRQEVANLALEVQGVDTTLTQSRNRRNTMRQRVRFDQADLNRQLNLVGQRKLDLEKRRTELALALKTADQAWQEARMRLDGASNESERIEAEALLRQREVARKTHQAHLDYIEKTAQLLDRQQQIWQERYALLTPGTQLETLKAWQAKARSQMATNQRLTIIEQRYQIELQQQISTLESRLLAENLLPGVHRALTAQLETLRSLAEKRSAFNQILLSTQVLENRFLDEIEALAGEVPLGERLVRLASTWRTLWNYEVWQIDDRPVTVGKLIFALVIFIIGMILAKFFLSLFQRRFLSRTQLKDTTASTIHKVLSYVTYLMVLLLALRIVNIPLAAFAFLGGAIAIGVGFGAQNLINNFISGFIIMGEQPINIGDLIEVDGVVGQVEEIGARSTRVRTGENIHILVPNSSFLEKNITNWTLADHKIRAKVVVGVAYGSPVEQVERLLLETVRSNARILQTPDPFVLFTDFGDNALNFEIHFWITVQRVIERRTIESSVRFAIDERFRRAGVTIAFPQRDVHLDSTGPIEVQLKHPPQAT